ncbi:MAG TPA: N-acetylglucosamine-6-phosphate deacetylase [Terriglobales bacterium]|nr:N-acetylglucosamine-6-phosphate deacetylase [Terriglobales bacterium]
MKTVFTARLAFTPLTAIENPIIMVEDGYVVSVSSRASTQVPDNVRLIDLADSVLAPGFVDIHVHGGAGYDVMQEDREGRARMERHFAKHGVTSYCPTTVTAPLDSTYAALERIAKAAKSGESGRAKPAGIHIEGPFISHAKRGVHPPENLVEPSIDLFEKMWQAAQGKVAVVTIAPEIPGALETIKYAAERGVCNSLGHSNATMAEAEKGIAAGGRHATHTFNAMRPLDHRDPGILGAVLSDDRVTADIIADGIHVHPSMVSLFLRAKGRDRAVLITDAISATGMGDGQFQLGPFKVEVKGDRCEYEGKLAGSVLTLDRAVTNIMKFSGWSLQHSVQLATLNPARVIGRNDIGIIAPGSQADFVVLSREGKLQRTITNGFAE